jgi:hypothetical protein
MVRPDIALFRRGLATANATDGGMNEGTTGWAGCGAG